MTEWLGDVMVLCFILRVRRNILLTEEPVLRVCINI